MSIIHRSQLGRRIAFTVVLAIQLTLTACGALQPDPTKVANFKIGLLNGGTQFDNVLAGFKAGLADLGYVEGKNVTYVYDGPSTTGDKLSANAQNLLTAKPDLIASFGTPATAAAKKFTDGTTIPVVFTPVADPVHENFVQSLKNPGGNLTGVASGVQVHAQRLEWLLKIAPTIKRLFIPYDPSDAAAALIIKTLQDSAPKLGVELVTQEIHTADDVTAVLGNIPDNVDAIFVIPTNLVGTRLKDFVQVSLNRKLPLSSNVESQVNLGSLITFSFGDAEAGKQLAGMADRILKGTKPADLPVESAEFFLAINLKTAQAIGVTVPDDILRAASVIVR